MIHALTEPPEGFVISSHGMWLPGVYETRQAASYAFQFSNEQLADLGHRICVREKRHITTGDLRAVRTIDA
jgi:hypothetical protein